MLHVIFLRGSGDVQVEDVLTFLLFFIIPEFIVKGFPLTLNYCAFMLITNTEERGIKPTA